ncbi:uncharacterized protein LOC130925270 isoform X2 [Corythoichthys intestinalis]|uniref:uncharacterized protein LOC130925270 isoform X2 n=1 Tax=Corythoichthys intestinalis TaxID=161448 RepID=UPI0025A52134|nr:uncharacterized protein LOC130925270 isoform X2 [Corythoichthys intestinalis]
MYFSCLLLLASQERVHLMNLTGAKPFSACGVTMSLLVVMIAACATFLTSSASAGSYPSRICVGDGQEVIINGCFSFHLEKKSFWEAQKYCQQRNAHLAIPGDKRTYWVLTARMGDFPKIPFWLGMYRKAWQTAWIFAWTYETKAVDYRHIGFIPSDMQTMRLWDDCLTVNKEGYYEGYDCTTLTPFICEANDGPVCPTCNCTACPSCPAVCAPLPEPCPPTPAPCGIPPPTPLPSGALPPAPTCRAPPPCALHPGPGDGTLWHQASTLTKDVKDSCMLVMSTNAEGFLVRLLSLLGVGRSIVIRGQVRADAERVTFQLHMANGTALNLGFRISGREIALDSKLGDSWDIAEETETDSLPIEHGRNFEVIIQCYDDRFRVTVDGIHQEDFKYRGLDPQIFTALTARRDVSLMDVKLI